MKLKEYREAVLAWLKTNTTEFKSIEFHGGVLNEDDLKRFSLKSPAIRIACLGVSDLERTPTGEWTGPVTMIAYVIVSLRGKANSSEQALDYTEKLAEYISYETFGLDFTGPAILKDMSNLYSTEIDKKGVALASLSWVQDILTGRDHFDEEIIQTDPLNELETLSDEPIINAHQT